MLALNSGSFRTPFGHVYEVGQAIRNVVASASAQVDEAGRDTRFFDELVEARTLLDLTDIELREDRTVRRVLECKGVISKCWRILDIVDWHEG